MVGTPCNIDLSSVSPFSRDNIILLEEETDAKIDFDISL